MASADLVGWTLSGWMTWQEKRMMKAMLSSVDDMMAEIVASSSVTVGR